jgi:hypothetical protein
MCASPTSVAPGAKSPDLGTGATCDEVVGSVGHVVCGNFVAPRTMTVNGTAIDCVAGGTFTLPTPQNGGFCFVASAGQYPYAYFTTF